MKSSSKARLNSVFGAEFMFMAGLVFVFIVSVFWLGTEEMIYAGIAFVALALITFGTVLLYGRNKNGDKKAEFALKAVMASLEDSVIVIDGEGRVEEVNPVVEKMFGYTRKELVGENINILMPSPYRQEHDGYIRRYKKTGAAKIIGVGRRGVQGLHKDGSIFSVELSVSEFFLNGKPHYVGFLHKDSVQMGIENALKQIDTNFRLKKLNEY